MTFFIDDDFSIGNPAQIMKDAHLSSEDEDEDDDDEKKKKDDDEEEDEDESEGLTKIEVPSEKSEVIEETTDITIDKAESVQKDTDIEMTPVETKNIENSEVEMKDSNPSGELIEPLSGSPPVADDCDSTSPSENIVSSTTQIDLNGVTSQKEGEVKVDSAEGDVTSKEESEEKEQKPTETVEEIDEKPKLPVEAESTS